MPKNSVADRAFRDMTMKIFFRQRAMRGSVSSRCSGARRTPERGGALSRRLASAMMMRSRPRKKLVSCARARSPCACASVQYLRHVRRFHEAVSRGHAIEAVLERLDRHALLVGTSGTSVGEYRQQDHLLVQHLVVLEVMQQHDRRALGVGRHEHRRARHARRLATLDVVEEERRAAAMPACRISLSMRAALASRWSSA